jgi:hypothetical protein
MYFCCLLIVRAVSWAKNLYKSYPGLGELYNLNKIDIEIAISLPFRVLFLFLKVYIVFVFSVTF